MYAKDDGSYKVNQTEQNLIFKPHSFHMSFVIFPSYFFKFAINRYQWDPQC